MGFCLLVEGWDFAFGFPWDGKADAPVRLVCGDGALGETFCLGGIDCDLGVVERLAGEVAAGGNSGGNNERD